MSTDNPDEIVPVTESGPESLSPVIFILPPPSGVMDDVWLNRLREQFPDSAIAARPRLAKGHGITELQVDSGSPWSIVNALGDGEWADGLLVVRHGLTLPDRFAQRLARMVGRPGLPELTVFAGNHDERLNPLAGLDLDQGLDEVDSLVFNCAEQRWTAVADGEFDCCFLASPQQRRMVGERGPRQALVDEFYILDPARSLNQGKPPIAAVRAGLGHLRRALADLHQEGITNLPYAGLDGKPVILHVAHSWGGGIARWIGDQCRYDDQAHHLVLASDGHRDGLEHGQELVLFAKGTEDGRIQQLVLTPPISDSTSSHAGYRDFFGWLLDRYRVNRVVVSSLIGHSLDCLKSGLPTLQVLHDFYPASPVLDVDPLEYLDSAGRFQMKQALESNLDNLRFVVHSPAYWRELRKQWAGIVKYKSIQLVAPSRHVAMRWQRLFQDELAEIAVIPHGFRPAWDDSIRVRPKKRSDGRLNLVIVGRMSAGKGLGLLTAVLDELVEHAQITLVGAGKRAEEVFGKRGIDIILDYRPENLPAILAGIGPDAALFLSTVPETWSYVLSELRSLGIVPIATATGSFVERIRDGVDGVLVDPEPDSLIAGIQRLAADPSLLEKLAQVRVSDPDLEMALEQYRRLVDNGESAGTGQFPAQVFLPQRAGSLAESADLKQRIERANQAIVKLDGELERRADWAMRQQRLVRERTEWARQLTSEIEETNQARQRLQNQLDQLEKELSERTQWARQLESDIDKVNEARHRLQNQLHELDKELSERTRWARELDRELGQLRLAHAGLDRRLKQLELEHKQLELERKRLERINLQQRAELTSLDETRIQLEHHLNVVLNSMSWRLTRPIRFLTRTLRKLLLHRAWNPLTWPRLVSVAVHSIRTLGWRQSVGLLHHQPLPGVEGMSESTESTESALVQSSDQVPEAMTSTDQASQDLPVSVEGVELPGSEQPVASIVIPVYNKVELTRACLESIARTPTGIEYEVIVVDDCSSDRTADFLAACSGIVALRNDVNAGFIDSCNRGADQARGEFVVFLNNDTTVTPGWLDALIEPFRNDADVGIVGARLVYPDGRLQEVGGIIFNDASGWNYGRDEKPDLPHYSFVSEADYVSGACLAIRRSDFADLGGFDTRYRPAYYEDTDLCFQVRERGKKVIVQPAATIVHHEGATSGTDESGGVKQYQAVNREKFREKWAEVLADHPPPEADFERQDPIRHARYRRFGRRMLLIDAVTPQPDHDSGSVRIVAIMTLLKELGYQVSFMAENRLWVNGYSEALQQAGIEVLCAPHVATLEHWLEEHGADLDLVLVSRHYVLAPMLKMIRHYCPQATLVFDTVDLHFLREEREAEVTGSGKMAEQARATRDEELSLIRSSDATLVVSPVEQELLTGLVPDADVRIVSNIHDVHGSRRDWEDRTGLMFVGGFQHLPNVDAARWLVDEIFPLVRAEIPDIELHLIGSRMPAEILSIDLPGVRVQGFVEDIDPFLDGCRVSVAPLRYGAGVKGKVNQAMSHGLPVVATTCAAEGMFLEHDQDVLIGDTAQDFARQVVRAHQDREVWQRLSTGGLANVEKYFSRAAARRALQEIDKLVSAR